MRFLYFVKEEREECIVECSVYYQFCFRYNVFMRIIKIRLMIIASVIVIMIVLENV